jgi:hypothetical protein
LCARGPRVSEAGLDLVRAILGGALAAALDRTRDDATEEVDRLATRALEQHLERRLRSIHVIA